MNLKEQDVDGRGTNTIYTQLQTKLHDTWNKMKKEYNAMEELQPIKRKFKDRRSCPVVSSRKNMEQLNV